MATMKKEADGEHPASHYLVVGDPETVTTWALRVRDVDGKLDHGLMGAAHAALLSPNGYRGNRYQGPDKDAAVAKLKALYKAENMDWPDDASMSVDLPLGDATFSDDGTVVRHGLLFRCGDYPDKAFSFDESDMAHAVAAFQPCELDLEHVDTVLQGKLGTVQRIYPGDDGKSLMGEVHLPKWLDSVLDGSGRKVSATWDRGSKTLRRLALVRNPRVTDAALMAAFADAEKSPGMRSDTGQYARHDTPAGQATMQAGHDLMVARGAVCQTAAMASTHEMNATQAAHDLFVAHGAMCAPVTNSATLPKPNRSKRMSLKDWFTKQAEDGNFDPSEVDALFNAPPSPELDELKRQNAELKAQQDAQAATFARMAAEKRHAEAVTFASTQVAAHRVVPAATEKLAALAERIAAADSTATFAEGESPTLTLLAEFIAAQPDFTVFTTEGIKHDDLVSLFNRETTDDGDKPRDETTNAMLQATPTGRSILAARANGKN